MTQPDEDLDLDTLRSLADRNLEAPDSDAAEQNTAANPVDAPVEVHRGLEVGEWDAVEQSKVIDLEDDYR